MAKFIYKMQNILNLKLKLEEQQKMEFAAARKRLDEEEDAFEVLIREENARESKEVDELVSYTYGQKRR